MVNAISQLIWPIDGPPAVTCNRYSVLLSREIALVLVASTL